MSAASAVAGFLLLWLLAASAVPALVAAQSVSQEGGPLSDVGGTTLGEDSRPVHERGRTVREGSRGSMRSGPVRETTTGSMLSGPVSEWSAGPVRAGQPVANDGAVHEGTAGAVKKDRDHPIGESISSPMSTLGNLQNRLRSRLEQPSAPVVEAGDAAPSDRGENQALEGAVDEWPAAAEEAAAPGSQGESESQPAEQPATLDDEAALADEEFGLTDFNDAAENPTQTAP